MIVTGVKAVAILSPTTHDGRTVIDVNYVPMSVRSILKNVHTPTHTYTRARDPHMNVDSHTLRHRNKHR